LKGGKYFEEGYMKKMFHGKKGLITVIVMMIIMMAVTVAGCKRSGGRQGAGADISQAVTLRMYLLGDKSKDFDLVYAEINKILKEKVNATVEVSFLSWAEHAQRYSLLFAGGEEFDLIFTASGWAHYETTASMGGFFPLTENFLQTYAPDIWKAVPAMAWDQAKLGGNIYMVPNYANEFGADVYALRGDLMKKYGYNDITTLEELTEFFGKVAAGETGIRPQGNAAGMLYPYFHAAGYAVMNGSPSELFIINTQNPSDTKVTYLLDWDRFDQYCRDMENFFGRGFWSRDSLASQDQRQDGLLRGDSASMYWNLGTTKRYAAEANAAHPEWNVTLADFTQKLPKRVNSYINNGMAINANSKNKERAMMVLNEFYTNKAVYDLAWGGIEGVHWTAEGDKYYRTTPRTGDYGINGNCNWGWNNMNLARTEYIENPTALDRKHDEILARWNANVKPQHPLDGFTFDKSNVTTELSIVDSLIAEYFTPLTAGMAGNASAAVAALKQQLDSAGIRRVIDEVNRQAAAYLADKR
jgi:putative aldouronate transport system substrate-binding protein